MNKLNRKRWSEAENGELINLWREIPSITVIAIRMKRTRASIRVQASRLKLPRRHRMDSEQRVNDWTKQHEMEFVEQLARFTNQSGLIHIEDIAHSIKRSVDAVFDKLLVTYGSERNLFKLIVVTETGLRGSRTDWSRVKSVERQRERNCITCKKLFWSKGFHNRMCNQCRNTANELGW